MTGSTLAGTANLDCTAFVGGARAWTWGEVHAAAADLAQRLPARAPVCNLCATRVGFLVTWLAALRQGGSLLLPPSVGAADLAQLLAGMPDATVVVDDETSLRPLAEAGPAGLVFLPQAPAIPPDDVTLAWTPEWDRPAACLYTSGTTGQPRPHWRTLRQLMQGARALRARLDPSVEGGLAAWRAIVCSVPPQHMFGFETSVMLPLLTGIPVLDRRPLLPAAGGAALAQCGGPAAWIATPLHLRALAQAGEALPDCRLVLVSTMPLAAGLAVQVEPLVGAPVVEIFGSTETGALATRRTASETRWQPLGDVRLERVEDGTRVTGSHFPSPQQLADLVELAGDGRFELLGRHADLVKVGGRRASLAGLNLLLQDLPGLQDGAFYQPAGDAGTSRLVLLHAGALDRAAAERWLRSRIDPVFLPRTWLQVDRLPRDANGKMPRAALDVLWAAQRSSSALEFTFTVGASHPALPGHFPGRPIVPGVLLLDHVIERLRAHTGRTVTHLPRVKFSAALQPQETAHVQLQLRESSVSFRITALRAGQRQLIAQGTAVLGEAFAEAAP